MVRSGLVTAWRFAGWPTRRSPSSVKATIDGVVRIPSAFSMTFGVLPSITATQEFVVPRSIPMTLAMVVNPLFLGRSCRPKGALSIRPPYSLTSARQTGRLPLAHIGERDGPARRITACPLLLRDQIAEDDDRFLGRSRPPRFAASKANATYSLLASLLAKTMAAKCRVAVKGR